MMDDDVRIRYSSMEIRCFNINVIVSYFVWNLFLSILSVTVIDNNTSYLHISNSKHYDGIGDAIDTYIHLSFDSRVPTDIMKYWLWAILLIRIHDLNFLVRESISIFQTYLSKFTVYWFLASNSDGRHSDVDFGRFMQMINSGSNDVMPRDVEGGGCWWCSFCNNLNFCYARRRC